MKCDQDDDIVGVCCPPEKHKSKPQTIYQQSDAVINFTLQYPVPADCKDKCPKPFDLSAASELWVIFPVITGSPIVKKLSLAEVTITNGPLGQASVKLNGGLTGDTVKIPIGSVSIEARPTVGGLTPFAQIVGQLVCAASLFPGT